MVLGNTGDIYPDLTAQEFLYFYSVRMCMNGDVATFRKKGKVTLTERKSRHSNAKAWVTKFFIIKGQNWEFTAGEDVHRDFSVKAIWDCVPDNKEL